jgi:DNA-binding NtrC family response regulator
VPIDVRVIAGTKRNLRQHAAEGRFREDLFYRLNVLTIDLPPLRERREDLPLYVAHFLARFCERRGVSVPAISDAVTRTLAAYDWPGNVRELENLCERIAESCTCGRVRLGCLSASVLFPDDDAVTGVAASLAPFRAPVAADPTPAVESPRLEGRPLDDVLRQIEARYIADALTECDGNKSRAARQLGVKRSTFGDRLQRCGL